MGTKLSDIVPRKVLDFDQLKDKRIAIDASNALYQFISSIRQSDGSPLTNKKGKVTSHLQGLFARTANLLQKGIKPCFVMDGKPPEMKLQERLRRKGIKLQAEEKLKTAETAQEKLKYAKMTSRLTPKMVKEAKQLVEALGLPVIQAPQEADAQGAYMVQQKDCFAFASSDFDCLLHACPVMIPNLTLAQRRRTATGYVLIKPEIIFLKDVLKELDINQEQLIHIGILTGTDYNIGGIKGIGQKKALKLVKGTNDYKKMYKDLNVDFDWKKIYKLFDKMKIDKKYKLEWREPDQDKLIKLLVNKHDFAQERVESTIRRITGREKQQTGLGDFMK